MVVSGRFEFANALTSHKEVKVEGGHFSFIQDKYLEGTPRRPTKISFNSYKRVVSLFDNSSQIFSGNNNRHSLFQKRGRGLASIVKKKICIRSSQIQTEEQKKNWQRI